MAETEIKDTSLFYFTVNEQSKTTEQLIDISPLQANSQLKSLDLSDNNLADVSGRQLGGALSKFPKQYHTVVLISTNLAKVIIEPIILCFSFLTSACPRYIKVTMATNINYI